MFKLIARTIQFAVFHTLVTTVDRINRLPRKSDSPEVMRILRENLALKAQIEVLKQEIKRTKGKRPRMSLATRAAQVFAFLISKDNPTFQKYYLSASRHTLKRWTTFFRKKPWSRKKESTAGRHTVVTPELIALIVKLKTANPLWGGRKIRNTLKSMGILVSEPVVRKILGENGFDPYGPPRT